MKVKLTECVSTFTSKNGRGFAAFNTDIPKLSLMTSAEDNFKSGDTVTLTDRQLQRARPVFVIGAGNKLDFYAQVWI